jgi:hypothetical protein
LPTLDEGGLAVQQVGGNPNRGIRILGTSPDSQQRADRSPGGSCHGCPALAGKGKEPELRHMYNMHSGLNSEDDEERAIPIRKDDEGRSIPIYKDDEVQSIPIRKDDEVRVAATSRSSQDRKEDKSQRLRRGDCDIQVLRIKTHQILV